MKYATYNRNPSTALRKRPITDQKVAVAMSGGVDSGVAAALLVKEGYNVTGFHLHLWAENGGKSGEFINKCCSTESLEAARKTAALLKVPFYVLNFEDIFKKKVVDYFLCEFSLGSTPNPCVMCNKFVKFGKLLDYILGLGFNFLATGHYARIVVDEVAGPVGLHPHPTSFSSFAGDAGARWGSPAPATRPSKRRVTRGGEPHAGAPRLLAQWETRGAAERQDPSPGDFLHLFIGRDPQKDQSYFLYNLTQKQLPHILFPVGDYTKSEVREIAKRWKLPVASRPESQEICFFPETDYRPFLRRKIPQKIKPGKVVDTKGNVIGEHDGVPLYTIGQRHGFRIKSKFPPSPRLRRTSKSSAFAKASVDRQKSKVILPLYVVGLDIERNQLIVGWGKEAEKKEFKVKEVNWVNPEVLKCLARDPESGGILRAQVRIRHLGELYPCQIQIKDRSKVKVILDESVRAITPGQSAVFYLPRDLSAIALAKAEALAEWGQDKEVLGGGIIG